jgi:hypothetical protein
MESAAPLGHLLAATPDARLVTQDWADAHSLVGSPKLDRPAGDAITSTALIGPEHPDLASVPGGRFPGGRVLGTTMGKRTKRYCPLGRCTATTTNSWTCWRDDALVTEAIKESQLS